MKLPIFILKVRENVIVEDDIQLARYELANLFAGKILAYRNMSEALQEHGLSDLVTTIPALGAPFRGNGVGAFVATEPRISLQDLVRRLSYIQEAVVVDQGKRANSDLQALYDKHRWNSRIAIAGQYTILRIIPMFCLLECADVVLRYARCEKEIPALLDALVTTLLSERLVASSVLSEVPTRKSST